MGYSISILCWATSDFPAVSERFGWTLGEEVDPNARLYPQVTGSLNAWQLVFVDHDSLPPMSRPDARATSMVAPTLHFWVNDTSGVSSFSGHRDGQDIWSIWGMGPEHGVEGEPPLDVQSLIELITDEAEHDRLEFGGEDGDVDAYRLALRAFEAVIGMRPFGAWPRPCFELNGEIPVAK